mmetsp:Transcript_45866/g.147694  ORF Transcript_45866/g.147694 Transcript_45866/m.147694 type:complete len:200 (-) Transcript_45866:667-1266(-)
MPVRTGWRASASSTRSRSPRGLRSLRAAGCGGCSSWTGMCTTAMGRRPSSRRTRPSSSSRCTASGAASSLGPAPRAAWAAAPLQAEPSTCPSGARGWGMPSTWPRSTRCCCRSHAPFHPPRLLRELTRDWPEIGPRVGASLRSAARPRLGRLRRGGRRQGGRDGPHRGWLRGDGGAVAVAGGWAGGLRARGGLQALPRC